MQGTTLKRTRPGRTGSLRSARKALWLAIAAACRVLAEAQEPDVVLRACEMLCAGCKEYLAIMRAIEHPDAP